MIYIFIFFYFIFLYLNTELYISLNLSNSKVHIKFLDMKLNKINFFLLFELQNHHRLIIYL